MLLSVAWGLLTDVSGHPIGHIFQGQAVYEKKNLLGLLYP